MGNRRPPPYARPMNLFVQLAVATGMVLATILVHLAGLAGPLAFPARRIAEVVRERALAGMA